MYLIMGCINKKILIYFTVTLILKKNLKKFISLATLRLILFTVTHVDASVLLYNLPRRSLIAAEDR